MFFIKNNKRFKNIMNNVERINTILYIHSAHIPIKYNLCTISSFIQNSDFLSIELEHVART